MEIGVDIPKDSSRASEGDSYIIDSPCRSLRLQRVLASRQAMLLLNKDHRLSPGMDSRPNKPEFYRRIYSDLIRVRREKEDYFSRGCLRAGFKVSLAVCSTFRVGA